jgi:DNA repair ATPase RecN
MTKDEELQQLRAENQSLCEELQRKDEELQQVRKAAENLREGLKEAIKALGTEPRAS